MKKIGQSIERQMINTYKDGFLLYLKNQNIYFRKIANYMTVFNKCFTTANINSYRNLKIPQIKAIIENYAKQKSIDLNKFD